MISECIEEAANLARNAERIVTHLDADGLCAASVMSSALGLTDIKVVYQISDNTISRLKDKPSIFLDVGSSHLTAFSRFKSKMVVIDHHKPSGEAPKNILLLNSLTEGLSNKEACSATLSYLVARELNGEKELSLLAVVGIIGDGQKFVGTNKKILEDAISCGLKAEEGIKLFGRETRPLAKLISQSYDLKIDGITGNLMGAKKFLRSIGIPETRDNKKLLWDDLSEDEKRKLTNSIIRLKGGSEKITTTHYILPREFAGFKDARQLATLLNACGRLNRWDVGLRILSGDKNSAKEALTILGEYKQVLRGSIKKFQQGGYESIGKLIILSSEVPPEVAGTICSIITKGAMVPDNSVVCAYGLYDDGLAKISLRRRSEGPDLQFLLKKIMGVVGGESGGHPEAAGGVIPKERVKEFIEELKKEFI